MMEPLGDDELLYIFNKISSWDWKDKKSFPQVSKQFMKVSCNSLKFLNNSFPDLLFDILPSCQNMRNFRCTKKLSNSHLKLLAQSCPKLIVLILEEDLDTSSEPGDIDSDDDGLCAVGNACRKLQTVHLNSRLPVRDAGIVSLVTSCKNLTRLHLEGCNRVTDKSLLAIGESGIQHLNLGGCYSITDLGLEYLANGNMKNCLNELNVSKCGVHITEPAIVALLSQLPNIEILDLSWLINVTDVTLLAIGSKCLKLKEITLTGCEAITAEGLRAFSGHQTLNRLALFSCYNFSWEDVESVALTCIRLEYLGLMKRIKTPMPELSYGYLDVTDRICSIDWDEDRHLMWWD